MATVVNSWTGTNSGTTVSVTVSGVTSGNTLLAFISKDDDVATSAQPTGFVSVAGWESNNAIYAEVWKKSADGTEGTLTWTGDSEEYCLCVVEIQDVVYADIETGTLNAATGDAWVASGMSPTTTTTPNELIFAFGAWDRNTTPNANGNYTELMRTASGTGAGSCGIYVGWESYTTSGSSISARIIGSASGEENASTGVRVPSIIIPRATVTGVGSFNAEGINAVDTGTMYLAGGYIAGNLTTISSIDIDAGTIGTVTDTLTTARVEHASMESTRNGYVFGGWVGANSNNIERFNFNNETVYAVTDTLDTGAHRIGGTSNPRTQGYVFTGRNSTNDPDNSIEKFVFSTETCAETTAGIEKHINGQAVSSKHVSYRIGGVRGQHDVQAIEGIRHADDTVYEIQETACAQHDYSVGIESEFTGYMAEGFYNSYTTALDYDTEATRAITSELTTQVYGAAGGWGADVGYKAGGQFTSGGGNVDDVDKFTFATEVFSNNANSLTSAKRKAHGFSSPTFGPLSTNDGATAKLRSTGARIRAWPLPNIGDGKVYHAGGEDGSNSNLDKIQWVDASDDTTGTLSATLDIGARIGAGSNSLYKGYHWGGFSNSSARKSIVETLSFTDETVGRARDGISRATIFGRGVEDVFNASYLAGGDQQNESPASYLNEIEKLTHPAEAMSTLSETLTTGRQQQGAVSHIETSGYWAEGSTSGGNVNTIEKLAFSNETITNPSSSLSTYDNFASFHSADIGLFAGGFLTTEIEGIDFADDTHENPTAALTAARFAVRGGQANLYGYTIGGYNNSVYVTTIDRYVFSNNTNAANSNALATAQGNGAVLSAPHDGYFPSTTYEEQVTVTGTGTLTAKGTGGFHRAFATVTGVGTLDPTVPPGNIFNGYFIGGSRLTAIEKIDSTDTTSTITATTFNYPHINGGTADAHSAGYIIGGSKEFPVPYISNSTIVGKLTYQAETMGGISDALDRGREGHVGTESASDGYVFGGPDSPNELAIEKMSLTTESVAEISDALDYNRSFMGAIASATVGYVTASHVSDTDWDKITFSTDTTAVLSAGVGYFQYPSFFESEDQGNGYIAGGSGASGRRDEYTKLVFSTETATNVATAIHPENISGSCAVQDTDYAVIGGGYGDTTVGYVDDLTKFTFSTEGITQMTETLSATQYKAMPMSDYQRSSYVSTYEQEATVTGTGTLTAVGTRVEGADVTGSGAMSADASTMSGTAEREVTGSGAIDSDDSSTTGAGTMARDATGALTADDSTTSGTGNVITTRTGDGDLVSDDSAMSGTGEVEKTGTGALTPDNATMSGTGEVEKTGTGALAADNSATSGTGVVERTGSGALVSDDSTTSGSGTIARDSTGTLVSDDSAMSGTGEVEKTGTGALQADDASVSGTGEVEKTGTGALVAGESTTSGTGVVEKTGTGALVSDDATMSGVAEREIKGSGVLVADDSTMVGTGENIVTGSGVLVSDDSTMSGTGVREITGSGVLVSDDSSTTGVTEREITGSGVLVTTPSLIAGVAEREVTGVGVILPDPSTVSGAATRTITGFGVLIVDNVTLSGTAEREITATGVLVSGDSTTSGTGDVGGAEIIVGSGALVVTDSVINGSGTREITATGDLTADPSTMDSQQEFVGYGALVASQSIVSGSGFLLRKEVPEPTSVGVVVLNPLHGVITLPTSSLDVTVFATPDVGVDVLSEGV